MIKKIKILPIKFQWILILFFILFFISEWINGRFWQNDFKVYYQAMQNFLNGGPIYGIPFGLDSGFYKYTPFALLPFSIFYYIPFKIASIVYYIIVSIAILTVTFKVYHLFVKLFNINEVKKNTVLYLTTLVLINHFYRELHLGNVNVILLLLYVYSLELLTKDKQYLAGILMGVGILFKLHFIVLLPVLLVFKKYRTSAMLISTFIIGLLFPTLFLGFELNFSLLNAYKYVIISFWISTKRSLVFISYLRINWSFFSLVCN